MSKSSTTVVAERLTKLIEASGLSVNAWAKAKRIPARMAARLAKGQHATKLDTIDEIAGKLRIQPWELITPPPKDANPTEDQDGDLDYLLRQITDRKDRIAAYVLAAQVINAIADGLVVLPIRTHDPAEGTPPAESRAASPARKRTLTKRSTDPA